MLSQIIGIVIGMIQTYTKKQIIGKNITESFVEFIKSIAIGSGSVNNLTGNWSIPDKNIFKKDFRKHIQEKQENT